MDKKDIKRICKGWLLFFYIVAILFSIGFTYYLRNVYWFGLIIIPIFLHIFMKHKGIF